MWKRGIAFALIGLAVFSVTPQPITEVELQANKYAKFGGPVTLRCGFDGTDFTIQYISWTKIYAGAKRRVFVYEFSPLPFYNQSYNDLKGRAFLQYELGSGAMLDSISQPLSHYTSFQPESESAPNDELLPTKTDVEPHFKQNTQRYLTKRATTSVSAHRSAITTDTLGDKQNREIVTPTEEVQKFLRQMRNATTTNRPHVMRGYKEDSSGSGSLPFDEPRFERLKSWNNFVLLTINPVLLIDEAYYECLIKPIGGPAVADVKKMDVRVAPSWPFIDDTKQYFEEGENTTLYCRANVGKPAGELLWFRRRASDTDFKPIKHGTIHSETTPLFNRTVYAVSSLELQLFAEDDAAVYRCATKSSGPDEPLYYDVALDVKFPVRSARIDYQQDQETYICHANGNPRPKYTWKLIQPSSEIILTKRSHLYMGDLRRKNYYGITKSGFYRFKCTASNTFHASDIWVDMETDIWVAVPKGPHISPGPPLKNGVTHTLHPGSPDPRDHREKENFQGLMHQQYALSSTLDKNDRNNKQKHMMGTGFVHGQSNGFQHGNVGGYADNTNGGNVEDNTKGRYIDDNGDEPKRNNWFAGGYNNDQLNGHNSDGHVGGTGKDVVSTVYNNENTDGYKGDGYPSGSNEFPAAGYTNGVTTVENELFKERGPISHRNDDSIDSKDSDVDLLPTRHLTRYGLRPHSTTGQSRLSNERFITSSIAETRTGKTGRFEKPNFLTKNDYLRGRPLLRPNSPTQKDKGTGQSWNLNADLGPSRNTGKETEEKPGDAFNPNENFPGAARHNTMDRNDGLGDFPIDHTPHSLTGQANTIKPKPQSAESQNHDKNLQNVGGLQENEEEFKTGTLHVIAPELESSARRIGPQPVQPSQGFQQRAQPPFQNDHLYNRLPHELQPNAPVDRIQSTPNQQFPEHIVQPVKQNRFPGNRERGNAEHFPGSTEHGNMEYFPKRRDHGDMELFPNSRNHGYMEHFPDSTEHGSMEHFPDRREHGNLEGFTDGKEHGNLEVFPDRGHASVDMKSNADRRSGYLLQEDHDPNGNQDLRPVSDPSFDSSSYRNLGQQLALPSSQRFDNSDKTRNINVFDRNQYDFKNKPVSLRSGSRKLVSGAPRSDIDGFGAGDYNKQAPTTVNRVHPDNFQNLQKTHTSSEFDGEIVSPEHKGLYDFPERGLVESPAHNGALMLPGNNWPPVFREQNGPRIPQEYNHPSSLPGHNVLPDVPEQNGLTEEISPPFFPKLDIPSKQDADPLSGLFDMDGGDSKHQESADLPDPEDIKDGVVTATKLQGEIKAPPINHGKVRPTTHSDFDCSKRSDGVIESGCRAFYRCVSGKTFFVECDYNYVLNTDIGDCDRRENAPAPCGVKQDCMEKENGKYADAERDCTYYYTCHEGHFMGTNKCNPGLVFNEDRQICDWPDSAAESCKEASKSYVERYGR